MRMLFIPLIYHGKVDMALNLYPWAVPQIHIPDTLLLDLTLDLKYIHNAHAIYSPDISW